MSRPQPRGALLTLLSGLLLTLAPGLALAQDEQARQAEVAQLERLLEDLDAALEKLEPLARPTYRLELYDVRLLFYRGIDHPAPRLRVPGDHQAGTSYEGGGFTFDEGEEEEAFVLYPDRLDELITEAVGKSEWADPASISVNAGLLIVNQTELGHARIRRCLRELSRRHLRFVQHEVGFYVLPAALRQKVELQSRANKGVLPAKLLDELDAEIKAGRVKVKAGALLNALDNQRVFLHQGAERSYLSDVELSSGGGSSEEGARASPVVEADPIVAVLMTGISLDVTGRVAAEGPEAAILIDVRLDRARLREVSETKTPYGPLEFPRVGLDVVNTRAKVPSGAGMLVFAGKGQAQDDEELTVILRPRLIRE